MIHVSNIEGTVHYPQEFLNSLNISGLPPHDLMSRIGTPIKLLRNVSPPNMCNGSRLSIKYLGDNLIVATILTGPAAGQLAHTPRISMIHVSNIEGTVHYPQEFLNSLNISGLPPHDLMSRIGTPIKLSRNVSPPNM
ncbi:hypothetical protein JTB14_020412 [Gonioctena quinquepunctata]|nr:hypothetical protein JTB14_020412 [Gonioctena quinquepunctata]